MYRVWLLWLLWYNVVQCGTVWYSVVQCGAEWYGIVMNADGREEGFSQLRGFNYRSR